METNAIYCGDCNEVMVNHIPDSSIDLIYIDPPFFSNKQYEVIWGDGYELRAFEDRWKGGINNYIAWMEPKIRECRRVLKESGSIYLHCDWHATAHLRIMMDRVFGEKNFQNEIIWKRTHAHSKLKRFGPIHDTIYFYTKNPKKYRWNHVYQPYDEQYVKQNYRYRDKDGRRFNAVDMSANNPGFSYEWKGRKPPKGRYWAYAERNMKKLEKENGIYYSKQGTPREKKYLDEMKGVKAQDIWTDIPPISAHSKERLSYPTQKPEALLERIINASSNTTDILLDPMCGCGTAIAVAQKTKRRWVGIDVSPTACKLMVKRMKKLKVKITEDDIIGLPRTLEQVKTMEPFEFQNWVCQKLMARVSKTMTGDMGVDGWIMGTIPLQVKQSEGVGRNAVDNFETAIRRKKRSKGIIVAFSFTRDAHEEVARAILEEGLEIELRTVQDILAEG